MRQETRTLLAVVLSIGILIGYTVFFAPKPPLPSPGGATTSTESSPRDEVAGESAPASAGKLEIAEEPVFPRAEERTVRGETKIAQFSWTSVTGDLSSFALKGYREKVAADSPLIDLVRSPKILKHLRLSVEGAGEAFPEEPYYAVESAAEDHVVFSARSSTLAIRETYSWNPETSLIDLSVEIENLSAQVLSPSLSLTWEDVPVGPPPSGFLAKAKQGSDVREPVGFFEGKREVLKEPGTKVNSGKVYWAGIEDRYFVAALLPVSREAEARLTYAPDRLSATLSYGKVPLAAGQKRTELFRAYLGPKDRAALLAAGNRLEEAIDYGWFEVIAVPILFLLKAFEGVVHNWGLAIIALTVFIKLLLSPITRKSMQSMKAMQNLQPELAKLREKYKDDREKLNVEMMGLFKTHKVNPVGGCLPMLLQMPIYIALYKVLYTSIDLYHAPFFWYYKDLAAADPYFVAPVLLTIFMVLQQKFTPASTMDPMQQKMMMFMPIMFGGFMVFLPAGLVIYIFVNTFMSVIEQWMMRKDLTWRGLFKKVLVSRKS